MDKEEIETALEQEKMRVAQLSADLKTAKNDCADAISTLEKTVELFELQHNHWWWQSGLRFRKLVGSLRLMNPKPLFPYDRARIVLKEFERRQKRAKNVKPASPR